MNAPISDSPNTEFFVEIISHRSGVGVVIQRDRLPSFTELKLAHDQRACGAWCAFCYDEAGAVGSPSDVARADHL